MLDCGAVRDKLQGVTSRTLYQVLQETARAQGDAAALRQPLPTGKYLVYSWRQYQRAAEEIAAGLRSLGIAKGDTVALNSETRLEFYLADLGVLTNGSIAAALYPSYPAPDLVRTIESAGARAVFVEDPATLHALRSAKVDLWILLTGEAEGAHSLEGLARQTGARGAYRRSRFTGENLFRAWNREIMPSSISPAAPPANPRWHWSRIRRSSPISIWDPAMLPMGRTITPWPFCSPRTSPSG